MSRKESSPTCYQSKVQREATQNPSSFSNKLSGETYSAPSGPGVPVVNRYPAIIWEEKEAGKKRSRRKELYCSIP